MSSCGCKHFNDESALKHIAKVQVEGWIANTEPHAIEVPSFTFAFADGLRDMATSLLLLGLLLQSGIHVEQPLLLMAAFAFGLAIWRGGRSAWLGWSRLERLHRILEQEKYEIDHHREQEREELTALYQAKGLQGKLLNDVIDLLMADGERLLKVMMEEELGYRLQCYEHPLKQGLGAFLGSLLAAASALLAWVVIGPIAFAIVLIGLIVVSGALPAWLEKNHLVDAIVWTLSLSILATGMSYFFYQYLTEGA